jgi:hypothetical protein
MVTHPHIFTPRSVAMPRLVYLLGLGLGLVALGLALTDWALSLRPG